MKNTDQEKEDKLVSRMLELRMRAERLVKPEQHGNLSKMSADEIARLIHELETHQIELEMQNKELFLTQEVLVDVRDEFRQLYETAPVGYLTTDTKGHVLKTNRTFTEMLGIPKEKLNDVLVSSFINHDFQDIYFQHRTKVLESHAKQSCVLSLKIPSAEELWVRLDSTCVLNALETECFQIRSACIDITQQKLAEDERYKLSRVVESSPSAIFITNFMGDIEYINPKFTEITGYTSVEAIGQNPRILQSGSTPLFVFEEMWEAINEGKDWYGKLHNKKKNGDYYWARNCISSVKDSRGIITHFVALQDDVTHENELSEKLSYQASHDSLTGLINRYEFERRIDIVLSALTSKNNEHALCFMDLDQFKIINDSCGHIAGDQLLRELGEILHKTVRTHDTLARLGGDEFGVLLKDCSLEQAHRIASAILQTVQDYNFRWENRNYNVGISIGLVSLNKFSTLKESLMRADAACYQAKDRGRNRIHEYRAEDSEMALRRGEMRWVARINNALKEDRFHLYAQPIVPTLGTDIRHFEALIRMIDENGQLILPEKFLPAAEHYNIIEKIDAWTIKNVFNFLSQNISFLDRIELFSINLSGPSISSKKFLQYVYSLFRSTAVPAQKICFEITETVAISNMKKAKVFVSTLQELGCSFSLDDFGSGLSSFGYLKNLPVDYLKIDGMFVKDIANNKFNYSIVKSINDIGQVLGMKTIAEFVENEEIKKIMDSIGVDYLQGNGISRPMPIEDIHKLLQ